MSIFLHLIANQLGKVTYLCCCCLVSRRYSTPSDSLKIADMEVFSCSLLSTNKQIHSICTYSNITQLYGLQRSAPVNQPKVKHSI